MNWSDAVMQCWQYKPPKGIKAQCKGTKKKICRQLQSDCDEKDKIEVYEEGSTCDLTCEKGYLLTPLLVRIYIRTQDAVTVQYV